MLHALEGFSDAGHAIKIAATHLKDSLDTELVASFAIDELLDYRSRRPLMTFKTDHFTDYDDPELNLYALHDSVGTPFLLLAGLEPDLKWERFITACVCWPNDSASGRSSALARFRWRCRIPGRSR